MAKKKILVVDDTEFNRDLVVQLLEEDYDMVIAENGAEALTVSASERPDLILMDLGMPVMDGWEATRRLKLDERTKHIPIVALTGHALAGHAEGARQAGCDAFVTKPCLPDALVAEIQRMLSAKSESGSAKKAVRPGRTKG